MCRKLAFAATLVALTLPAGLSLAADNPPAPAVSSAPIVGATTHAAPVKATAEQRALADRGAPLDRAAFWNQQVQIDPHDVEAGLKLANSLRAIGQYDQAAQAAQAVSLLHPDNIEALLEFSRARIEAGHGFYALDPLRQAAALAPNDWRASSLLGVAFEQIDLPDDALAAYQRALVLSPNNPAVLSNLGMFHAAHGEPAQAETLLRTAIAQPGATAQERQNLAYVLAAQGKLAEAEKLVREDLPPELANNNIAYLHAVAAGQAQPAPQAAAPPPPALRGG